MPPYGERLGETADFLGAIRLPSDAFKREGTNVVTDIVFFRKRVAGEPAKHADPAWVETEPLDIEGVAIPINRYFRNYAAMVLRAFSRKDRLYDDGYSLTSNGALAEQASSPGDWPPLPERTCLRRHVQKPGAGPTSAVPRHRRRFRISPEGAGFFVGKTKTASSASSMGGPARSVPVVYGGTTLKADGNAHRPAVRRPSGLAA